MPGLKNAFLLLLTFTLIGCSDTKKTANNEAGRGEIEVKEKISTVAELFSAINQYYTTGSFDELKDKQLPIDWINIMFDDFTGNYYLHEPLRVQDDRISFLVSQLRYDYNPLVRIYYLITITQIDVIQNDRIFNKSSNGQKVNYTVENNLLKVNLGDPVYLTRRYSAVEGKYQQIQNPISSSDSLILVNLVKTIGIDSCGIYGKDPCNAVYSFLLDKNGEEEAQSLFENNWLENYFNSWVIGSPVSQWKGVDIVGLDGGIFLKLDDYRFDFFGLRTTQSNIKVPYEFTIKYVISEEISIYEDTAFTKVFTVVAQNEPIVIESVEGFYRNWWDVYVDDTIKYIKPTNSDLAALPLDYRIIPLDSAWSVSFKSGGDLDDGGFYESNTVYRMSPTATFTITHEPWFDGSDTYYTICDDSNVTNLANEFEALFKVACGWMYMFNEFFNGKLPTAEELTSGKWEVTAAPSGVNGGYTQFNYQVSKYKQVTIVALLEENTDVVKFYSIEIDDTPSCGSWERMTSDGTTNCIKLVSGGGC